MKLCSLRALCWSVGLVVLWESWLTFQHTWTHLGEADHSSGMVHVRLLLCAAEMVAAGLFLVPGTRRLGGYSLLVIFAFALVVHGLHGGLGGMEPIIVYAAAVFVVLATAPGHRAQA